jgi:general transcription factor 3C polypeptide 3 (transcription factor C subunit 4)
VSVWAIHSSHYTDILYRDVEDSSEADSDYRNVQSSIAKFKDSLCKSNNILRDPSSGEGIQREQVESRGRARGRPRGRPRGRGRGHGRGRGRGRGGPRGPHRAAEPTVEIKFRLGKASQAFIEEKYDEAMEIVSDVIRINAETHEAWILLASIFKELGDIEKTLTALMCAAHLRPRDVAGWLSCAQFALEETGDLRPKFLVTAKLCYQSAIRASSKDDIEARCRKAALLRELGSPGAAIYEYKRVLSRKPHDTAILRLLAEVYIDRDDPKAALDLYRESIAFYQKSEGTTGQVFGWSDINIYVELYAYLGQYDVAIRELKSLSRWALGRSQESWWDNITDDDREWDADNSRRILIDGFVPNRYPVGLYGEGLPLELRVKLGIYRLRLGHHLDALVGSIRPPPQLSSNFYIGALSVARSR